MPANDRSAGMPAVILDVAGMVLDDFAAQHGAVDMRVDFGGGDALVPQHALDGPQVGASLEQVGGKRVAEGVGADGFPDTRAPGQLLDEVEYHDAPDAVAPAGEKHVILEPRFQPPVAAVGQPIPDFFDGSGRDGHEPLLAPLAVYLDEAFIQIEV